MDEDRAVEVHLLQFPVPLWARAREHNDGMQREFALMGMGRPPESGERPVPIRLIELSRTLQVRYADATTEQEARLQEALERDDRVLDDLVYVLPPSVADASRQLGALLDEADEYCRRGDHLLTLATPGDLVAFRHWFLGEMAEQVDGRAPVPWPEYDLQG